MNAKYTLSVKSHCWLSDPSCMTALVMQERWHFFCFNHLLKSENQNFHQAIMCILDLHIEMTPLRPLP